MKKWRGYFEHVVSDNEGVGLGPWIERVVS